jgi:hypothetical protein
MACWFKCNDVTGSYSLVWLGDSSTSEQYWQIDARGGDPGDRLRATVRSVVGGNFHAWTSSSQAYTANTWHHAAMRAVNSTMHDVFLDAAHQGQSADSTTPTGTDRFGIGRHLDSSPGNSLDGVLAEVAIWNVSLSTGEIEALSNGANPTRIRRASLQGYWPLYGVASPETDYQGAGNNLTLQGTAQADHAPVGPPLGFDEPLAMAFVGGSTSTGAAAATPQTVIEITATFV